MNHLHWKPQQNSFLTRRETEATARAAEGLSHKEAGKLMSCAPTTVKRFWLTATDKTGARNRCELVAMAIVNGWISPLCLVLCLINISQLIEFDNQPIVPVVRMVRSGRNREQYDQTGIHI